MRDFYIKLLYIYIYIIMDTDVIIGILSKLDPDSLWSMCRANKGYMRVCKENMDIILRNVLREYNVNYKDPRSLVYIERVRVRGMRLYRYMDINNFKREDGSYKLGDIFLRYKRVWYNEVGELNLGGLGLTSIPKMPKLGRLICEGNDLRELPDFERLEYLDCSGNNIERLGNMPMLLELQAGNNPLREIGGLERLVRLEGGNLLSLERLWGMQSLDIVNVRVSRKIKLEDIRSEGGIVIDIMRDGMRSIEEYIPETVNVYIGRLDLTVKGDMGG